MNYISSMKYFGKDYYFMKSFGNIGVDFVVRNITTNDIVTNYRLSELYGYTNSGIFSTDFQYFKLYECIKFSHFEPSFKSNHSNTLAGEVVDENHHFFLLRNISDSSLKDIWTLGGILVNTNWYTIIDDYIYIEKQDSYFGGYENVVYRIIDKEKFNRLLTKLKVLKRKQIEG